MKERGISLGDLTDRADVDSDASDSDESNEVSHSLLILLFVTNFLCLF